MWTSFDGGGVQSNPHIGSVITGRGFGAPSPESQCSDDLPAQHGIDESADVFAIGNSVRANELRIKTARNRLTNEIAKERSRCLCKTSVIDRKVC